MIDRIEIQNKIEVALRPMFEKADKWGLSEKTWCLVCDKAGQFSVVRRTEVGDRKKISNITEFMLHEKITSRMWEKIIAKAGICLRNLGLYDRGEEINERKQQLLQGQYPK